MMELRNLNREPLSAEVDQSISKIVSLAAITIIFAFGFSYSLGVLFDSGEAKFPSVLLVSAIGFLALFLLNVVFIKSRWRSSVIIFLESVALLVGFSNELSSSLVWGVIFSFLLLIWADYSGTSELKNMLKVGLRRISKRALPKAIMALAIFSSIAYYSHIQAVGWVAPGRFFVSQSIFEKIITPAAPLIKKFVPEFDLSISVDELLLRIAENRVKKNPKLKDAPEILITPLTQEAVKELKEEVNDAVGVSLNPQARVSRAIYDAMLERLVNSPDRIRNAVPIVAALIIFLIVTSFTWLIRWVATFIAIIIYEICMALGFSILMMEGRSREIVVLK